MTRIGVGILGLLALLAAPSFAAVTVDGSAADPNYGPALIVQDNATGYGSAKSFSPNVGAGSQLDQLFTYVSGDTLYLAFAGNLESNGNHLNLFFDTSAGGQNPILPGVNPQVGLADPLSKFATYTDPNDPNNNLPGLTFPSSPLFTANYFLTVSLTADAFMYVDYARLYDPDPNIPGEAWFIGQARPVCSMMGGLMDPNTGDANAPAILAAYDNSNQFGVPGGDQFADGSGSYTGVEFAIPLSALGNPSTIDLIAFIGNGDYGHVSNQFIPGLGGNVANLGDPRAVDLSGFAGYAAASIPMSGSGPAEDLGCCTLPDGTRTLTVSPLCTAFDGVWAAGEDCVFDPDPGLCEITAACCLPDDPNCHVLTEYECLSQGGTWFASQPDCSTNPCSPGELYAPGEPNGWDNTTSMPETGGDTNIFAYSYDPNFVDSEDPNSHTRFDILRISGDWDSKIHGSGNQWFSKPHVPQMITITLDANTYDDGWLPVENRVGVSWEDPNKTWTAVGSFQSEAAGGGDWDNAHPGTLMTARGGGIYTYDTELLPAGTYEWKAVVTGSWDSIGGNSRNVNSDNSSFTVDNDFDPVTLYVNVLQGTLKVEAGGPLCETGDVNCDGSINFGDIDPFVLAITDELGYNAAYPECDRNCADVNDDGNVNFGDIDPFVALITGG